MTQPTYLYFNFKTKYLRHCPFCKLIDNGFTVLFVRDISRMTNASLLSKFLLNLSLQGDGATQNQYAGKNAEK